jgi:hypothetical protein
MRQMGGPNDSWTVPVFLLRGLAQAEAGSGLPTMVQLEDPIPTNGNPHPWLALTEDVNQQGNGFLHPDWQPVIAEHQVGSPQPPPGSLVQLNSIPAEQGVNAGDGSVPENNVYDDLEDEGFNFEDLEDAGLDFGHIVSDTDSTDDQLVLMNVQHAISLSDALAAAIAEVQLNPFPRSERTVVHPIWGPMPNPAENPLAIVPFVPAPPPLKRSLQQPLLPMRRNQALPRRLANAVVRFKSVWKACVAARVATSIKGSNNQSYLIAWSASLTSSRATL